MLQALTPHRRRQLWYAPLLTIAMALMLLRVLAAARLLDLSGFAQFSAGLLVSSSFGMLGCVGVHAVLQRDMPMLIVRGCERRGAVLLTQSSLLAGVLALLGLTAAAAGWSVAQMSGAVTAAGVLHGFTQQLFLVATVESRSRGQPLRFASQMLVRAVAVALLGLGTLAWLGSPVWALLAEALTTLFMARSILAAAYERARLGWTAVASIALSRITKIPWGSAMALLSVSLVSFVAQFSDRWIASELLDPSGFAVYSFAWTLPLIAQSIQLIVNTVMFPLVARRHAIHGPDRSFRISAMLSVVLAVIGALLAFPTGWLLATAVKVWLPAYEAAIPLLFVFVAVAVLRTSDFWTTYLTVAGHERILLVLNIAATAGAMAVWAWLRWPTVGGVVRPIDVAVLAPMIAGTTYAATALAACWKYASSKRSKSGNAGW